LWGGEIIGATKTKEQKGGRKGDGGTESPQKQGEGPTKGQAGGKTKVAKRFDNGKREEKRGQTGLARTEMTVQKQRNAGEEDQSGIRREVVAGCNGGSGG